MRPEAPAAGSPGAPPDDPTRDLSAALARARALHAKGDAGGAERACSAILAAQPDQVDALNLSAVLDAQRGRLADAERSLVRALAVAPRTAGTHANLAQVLLAQGRGDEALAAFERAIELGAAAPEIHCRRGNALAQLGRHAEALASFDRALAARPDYPEAQYNRGAALQRLGRYDEAIACYDAVLRALPRHPFALNNRGTALQALGRHEDALACYDMALAARPDYADALNNRGSALLRLERFADALASYERAAALGAETAETLVNRGNALHELGRHAEALVLYERSLAQRPDHAATHNNRGAALQALGRYDDALSSYARALALAPDYAEAHYNDALCRILVGDYERGWEALEWRWRTPALAPFHRKFGQPLWLGDDDVTGKTILLHAEFGYGDTLQFCRYAEALERRGARVVMEAPAPLAVLLASLRGVAAVVVAGEPLPPFDLHCPVMSLPHAFRTTQATIPDSVPYLAPPPDRVTRWAVRLGPPDGPRVGIAWAGNPAQANDRNRSLRFDQLGPLLLTGIRWVSLQKDVRSGDRAALAAMPQLARFEDELRDFADTAALIGQLDLVVTVDTSVAHLAGALGKQTWVMLSKPTDWHYPLTGDASPWYPTMRLFRQPRPGDWASVVGRIATELGATFAPGRRPGAAPRGE